MSKLAKCCLPQSHTWNDFEAFGPVATKDGEFHGTYLADFGYFSQTDRDSNKSYSCAVVQSKIDKSWYTYVEYGRTGNVNNQFQFTKASSKEEAQSFYIDQCEKKNSKRGQWVEHKILGKILQPKPGKDCYLVRNQAKRLVRIPACCDITNGTTATKTAPITSLDSVTAKLLADLSQGSLTYTRSVIEGDSVPSLDAIEQGRKICDEATKIANKAKKYFETNKDLIELTNILYSRIPMRKDKHDSWVLDPSNIQKWRDNLDTFASVASQQTTTVIGPQVNFGIKALDLSNGIGKWLKEWFLTASKNRHDYVKSITINNIFELNLNSSEFNKNLDLVRKTDSIIPEHQPKERKDTIDTRYDNSGTYMLFHGSRSVNLMSIMENGLRLPKTLSNVTTNGALLGPLIYHADDFRKSVGYTSYENSYWTKGSGGISSRGAFMFISDVICGNILVAPKGNCYNDLPKGYGCVMGKGGYTKMSFGTLQNNEYVTMPNHVNLRYLVEFS